MSSIEKAEAAALRALAAHGIADEFDGLDRDAARAVIDSLAQDTISDEDIHKALTGHPHPMNGAALTRQFDAVRDLLAPLTARIAQAEARIAELEAHLASVLIESEQRRSAAERAVAERDAAKAENAESRRTLDKVRELRGFGMSGAIYREDILAVLDAAPEGGEGS